jgi:hypothetical protein
MRVVHGLSFRWALVLVVLASTGSAWACGGADESEVGRAVSAGAFEVVGISPTHLALREYTSLDCDESEQRCPADCKYSGVPALAKKFEALSGQDVSGGAHERVGITLHFLRYKPGEPVHLIKKSFEKSFPIQEPVWDARACTTDAAAQASLAKAKAFAAKVGIDLKKPVSAVQLKTPKLAAEECFPGTGKKECLFRSEEALERPFAFAAYSLADPSVCHGLGEDDQCFMPSSTAMQVWLSFGEEQKGALATEGFAKVARITQDRRVDNAGMSLQPMVAFSTGEQTILGVIFKFSYGCGAPRPSMHLVVLPKR